MSEDLFAAFGEVTIAGSNQRPQHNANDGLQIVNNTISFAGGNDEDDDDFGDFEDAAAVTAKVPTTMQHISTPVPQAQQSKSLFKPRVSESTTNVQVGRHPFADHMDFLFTGGDDEYNAGADDMEDLSRNPEAAMAYSKKLIAEREQGLNRSSASSAPYVHKSKMQLEKSHPTVKTPGRSAKPEVETRVPNKLKKKNGYVPAKEPDVLFDADEAIERGASESELDDFGDFEVATFPTRDATTTPSAQHDLLGLDEMPQPSISMRSSGPVPITDIKKRPVAPKVTPEAPVAAIPEPDDAWDDFEEVEPVAAANQAKPAAQHDLDNTVDGNKASARGHGYDTSDELPPTNIPPPASLLSMFPALFSTAQQTILDPLSRMGAAERQELLSHSSTVHFLQRHIQIVVVLGHIIAGRKLRWKRDQILAQSMRIGPAAAGGKGGMKLAGVDKSEVAKEDREVIDTVRLWKAQAGKFRGAVTAAASYTSSKLSSIPEISEQIPVKILGALEGGFVAPHACALCGLRREERATKVDVDVDDSFGEWWVQSMSMHLSCRSFWQENKEKLRSR